MTLGSGRQYDGITSPTSFRMPTEQSSALSPDEGGNNVNNSHRIPSAPVTPLV